MGNARLTTVDPATNTAYRIAEPGTPDLESMVHHIEQTASVIGVDTETTGLEPFEHSLRLIQISTGGATWLIDTWEWTATGQQKVMEKWLRRLFENEKIVKVLHNAKFDLKWLRHVFGLEVHNVSDTMLAANLLGFPASLAAVVRHVFDLDISKEQQASDWSAQPLTKEQLGYAAHDAAILPKLHERLTSECGQAGLIETLKIENRCVPAVAELELNGVKLDTQRWGELRREQEAIRANEAKAFYSQLPAPDQTALDLGAENEPAPINLNSHKQIKEAFANLGIFVENTTANTLEKVKHPAAGHLCKVKKAEKLLNTYLRKYELLIHPRTGRIHPTFHQTRVRTGRFSASNPNVQQIPVRDNPEFREAFVAAPGHLLITADYSQIELRILAEFSGDKAMAEAFQRGEDIHSKTAAMMFGKPISAVEKKERADAKNMNFALVYGQGDAATAAQMGVSTKVAKGRKQDFFNAMPAVAAWIRRQEAKGTRGQVLRTLAGRSFHADPNRAERTAVNYPIQGSSADITKAALGRLYREFSKMNPAYRPRLVNCVHDEVVIEVPGKEGDSWVEQIRWMVRGEMIEAARQYILSVPVEVDTAVAREWSK